jgi:hypothetical protein
MADRILTQRALNRALLARQLLLERSSLSIEDTVERVGGLQTQYAPSGYVGLWTRLAGFGRDDLTAALEEGRVVQATLMRVTIHIVSRNEFWRYAFAKLVGTWRSGTCHGSRARRSAISSTARSGCARRWPTGRRP